LHGVVEGFVAFGLSLYYNWKLTLVVLSGMPAAGLILRFTSGRIQRHIQTQHASLARATTSINFAIVNISLVKCFNTGSQESSNYAAVIQSAALFALRQSRLAASQMAMLAVVLMVMFMIGMSL
jgi:ATP-binding cassette, subfamily B (MDR/TAP), member 1